jgi:uncharacterized protein (DUF2141 family)
MKASPVVLLASLLLVEAAAQDRKGTITGVVVDSVSRQPVRKVMVTLEFPSPDPLQPKFTRANTDDAGAFAFHDLKPGQYRLAVERRDYTAPAWRTITVSPSEDPDPVRVELIPGAVVSGRILDEDGDPLNGCWVQARRSERPEQIVSPQIARTAAEPSAYRLFGLRPGKYILAVQCEVPAFQPRPFSAGPDPLPSLAYPLQFYPAGLDTASAEPIDLAAGTEKSGVDFRMRTAHVTQVRAVIAPSSAGWRGRDLFGGLIRQGDLSGNEFRGMTPDSSGNVFRFPQVFPGSYVLLAATPGPENRIGALQRVEVKDQPVNTVIELKHAIDIHGTVELESGANGNTVQLTQIYIQFVSDYPLFMSPEDAPVKQDGSFTLNSVIPMQWRLYANAKGPSVFIKSVWLGTKELSGLMLDLSSGLTDTLKIVISTNIATIRGTAPPGTTVAYRNLDDKLLSGQSRVVDQIGQFRIEGLAPGRYRVAAADSFDGPIESGREITIQEGETATVDLRK